MNKAKRLTLLAATGILTGVPVQAAVLAGWDSWGDTTTPYVADVTTTGFSATAASSTNRALSTFTSNDGTFGTAAGANTSNTVGVLMRESDNTVLTLTLNNNTGSAYSINSLHFDYERRSANTPNEIVATYVGGGLGPASTTVATFSSIAWDGVYTAGAANFPDYDITLGSTLSDLILADGESAVFTLTFNGGSGNSSGVIDNVAFQGAVVPEPSVAILGGLGVLMLLRRRRSDC